VRSSKDAQWLMKELLDFLEFKLEDKERFENMSGEAFAHALMMTYGAYLMNADKTGKNVIVPLKKVK
jgi:hypothetical protein